MPLSMRMSICIYVTFITLVGLLDAVNLLFTNNLKEFVIYNIKYNY